MHNLLLVTFQKADANSSEAARTFVYDTLGDARSFVGEGGRFSGAVADWFVIGGRWSGELSRQTWAKEVTAEIAKREQQHGLQVWGASYGSEDARNRQARLTQDVEALYRKTLPRQYQNKGLCWVRDTYQDEGYEDDAMIVDRALYDALLRPYEGQDEAYDDQFDHLAFVDLDAEPVSTSFINTKWLVVVDYHS